MFELVTVKTIEKTMNWLIAAYPETMALSNVIINRGYDESDVKCYIVQRSARIDCCFAIHRKSVIGYARQSYDVAQLLSLLRAYQIDNIQGNRQFIDELAKQLPHRRQWRTVIMVADDLRPIAQPPKVTIKPIEFYQLDDAQRVTNDCFAVDHQLDYALHWHHIQRGYLTHYVIEQQGQIAATGMWLNDHPRYGNIVGICTARHYRKKGYGKALSYALAKDIFRQRKLPYLRYDSTAAAHMYRQLGFQAIAEYRVLYLDG